MKHYRVTTASGEYTWEGSPEEIVKAMSVLDWEGGQSDFMTRVRERVSRGFQLPMVVTDSPLTFLQELDRLGLIKLKPAPMRISPNYTVDDWKRIDLSQEAEWRRAVEIFADRIQGRFLVPISKIEKNYEYGGFAVLALDCLLIETLQQFRMGKAKTPPGEGGEYFTSFLTETSFGEFFNQEMAKMFYQQFRNGILHQAEVKGTSRIRITENLPLVSPTLDGKGLVINRKRFHKQLVQEFKSYMDKLKNPTNRQLQKNFKKKMDYICRGA